MDGKKAFFFCMTVCHHRTGAHIGKRCGVVFADTAEEAKDIAWNEYGNDYTCELRSFARHLRNTLTSLLTRPEASIHLKPVKLETFTWLTRMETVTYTAICRLRRSCLQNKAKQILGERLADLSPFSVIVIGGQKRPRG